MTESRLSSTKNVFSYDKSRYDMILDSLDIVKKKSESSKSSNSKNINLSSKIKFYDTSKDYINNNNEKY